MLPEPPELGTEEASIVSSSVAAWRPAAQELQYLRFDIYESKIPSHA